jgi:hypothetical protein
MKPPRKRQSPLAAGSGVDTEQQATRKVYAHTHPFVLAIVAGDRRTEWGRYPSREAAEAIGRRLRAHGINARTSDTREATT